LKRSFTDSCVLLWTDSPYAADWIETEFGELIRRGMQEVIGSGVCVEFRVYGSAQVGV
jgi:hypothetical protein